MDRHIIFNDFLRWWARKLNDTTFVLIISILIGYLSGITAAILKVTAIMFGTKLSSFYSDTILLLIGFPLIGILLTILFLK